MTVELAARPLDVSSRLELRERKSLFRGILAVSPRGEWILIALLAAIVLGFLAGLRYVHPLADDLDVAATLREGAFFPSWRQQYLTWSGRYGSMPLVFANSLLVESLTRYRMALAGIVLATMGALYWFVATLAAGMWTRREILLSTLTLMAVYLSQMPGLGESVFWYSSSVTYQAVLAVALAHFASLLRFVRTGRRPWVVLASALLAFVAGFNEVVMLLLVAFYTATFIWTLTSNRALRTVVGSQMAIAMLAGAIVALSPGNAAREAMFPDRHQLVRSVAMTGLQTARFLGDWVSNGVVLIASILLASMGIRPARRLAPEPMQQRALLAIALVGIVIVVPVVVFPTYWETGMLGGHRGVNMAFFVFLLLWFFALTLWMTGSRHADMLQSLGRELRVGLVVLMLVGLTVTRNGYALGFDAIDGQLGRFDMEMRAREAALGSCRSNGELTCTITALQTKPASFVVADVSSDPRNWVNVAYARYYRLSSVLVRRSP